MQEARARQLAHHSTDPHRTLLAITDMFFHPENHPLLFDMTNGKMINPLGVFIIEAGAIVLHAFHSRFTGDARRIPLLNEANMPIEKMVFASGFRKEGFLAHYLLRQPDFTYKPPAGVLLPKITPVEIMHIINSYFAKYFLAEPPVHMELALAAWQKMRKGMAGTTLCPVLVEESLFFRQYEERGYAGSVNMFIDKFDKPGALDWHFSAHETMARMYGQAPRTNEIKQILARYRGRLFPIVIPYRRQDPRVIKEKRALFGLRMASLYGTRAHFFASFDDGELFRALTSQGVPATNVQAMIERRTLGQAPDARGSGTLTVEHHAPLSTSSSFVQNLALATARANLDMDELIQLQTDFLPSEKVIIGRKRVFYDAPSVPIPVIALRPRPLLDAHGKLLPRFFAHPGWRPVVAQS